MKKDLAALKPGDEVTLRATFLRVSKNNRHCFEFPGTPGSNLSVAEADITSHERKREIKVGDVVTIDGEDSFWTVIAIGETKAWIASATRCTNRIAAKYDLIRAVAA